MPEATPTKDDLLAAIAAERRFWEAIVAAVKNAGLTERSWTSDEPWTFRDLAGHVNGWRGVTVARLEAAARGEGTPTHLWPEGMSEDSGAGVDEINAWYSKRARDTPAASVLAESTAQFDALDSAVTNLSSDDLLTPGRFEWLGDLPIGPALLGYAFTHLHTDHVPEILEWLRRETGSEPKLPPEPPTFGYGE